MRVGEGGGEGKVGGGIIIFYSAGLLKSACHVRKEKP